MIIVVPMAGLGTRFMDGTQTKQKPLIKFRDKSLLEYALRSLPINQASEIIFVIRKEQAEEELITLIQTLCKGVKYRIVTLDAVTKGQAETVLFGIEGSDYREPILIHNCDTALISEWNFETDAAGLFYAFRSSLASYSYARVDSFRNILEIAEKRVISNFASSGTYWIDSVSTYQKYFEKLKNAPQTSELYVSQLMQSMLESSLQIGLVECDNVIPLGTPQDLLQAEKVIEKWEPYW